MRIRTVVPLVVIAGIGLSLGLSGCSGSSSGASGVRAAATSGSGGGAEDGSRVLNVVAGENFWGDIIEQIGGSHVRVTSIISDPNTDPHEYESDTRDAVSLARADLVLENGLGYDDFITKLLSASPSSRRQVLSVQTILDVTGSNPNPHIWYDTARLPRLATAIAAELAKLDPADGPAFAANARAFDASLTPLLDVIATIRQKYAGTKIAYTERVPGYLIEAAGLTLGVPVGFTQAVEDGDDPSPADTVAFDTAISTRAVKVLLYNGQVTDSQTTKIKQLAAGSHVPIVGVTETLPPTDADFQAWQLRQARELLAALGG